MAKKIFELATGTFLTSKPKVLDIEELTKQFPNCKIVYSQGILEIDTNEVDELLIKAKIEASKK